MKKILLIIIIVIILLSTFSYYVNNNPKIAISPLLKRGNKSGDLIYRVNLFGFIPLANAILETERHIGWYNAQKVYHLNASAKPLRWCARLFNGYAILDSYIDTQTYNPIFFRQEIRIPDGGTINKKVFYDQKNGIMTANNVERKILPDTQDPLSLLFNIRRIDFSRIKELEMNINTNQKNYLFKGTVQFRDISIHERICRIAFLQADIKRRDKNPYHQSKISAVLLIDKENIPLLVKVFANGFLINARLIDIK